MAYRTLSALVGGAAALLAFAWVSPSRAQSDPVLTAAPRRPPRICDAPVSTACQTRRDGTRWAPVADGTPCNDGNVCDGRATCFAGQCLNAGTAISATTFVDPSPPAALVDPSAPDNFVALLPGDLDFPLVSPPLLLPADQEFPQLDLAAAAPTASCLNQPLGPPLSGGSAWWYGVQVTSKYYVAWGLAAAGRSVTVFGNTAFAKTATNPAGDASNDLLIAIWEVAAPVGSAPASAQFCDGNKLKAVRRLGSASHTDRPAERQWKVSGNTLTIFVDAALGFSIENNLSVCASNRGIAGLDFDLSRANTSTLLNPIASVSLPLCTATQANALADGVAAGDEIVAYAGHTNFGAGPSTYLGLDSGAIGLEEKPGQSEISTFLIALESGSGALRWIKLLPSLTDRNPAAYNQPTSIILDTEGNILVVGTFAGNIDLGAGRHDSEDGSEDVFFAKYSPRGELLMEQTFGGKGKDVAGLPCPDGPGKCPTRVPSALSIDPTDGAIVLRGVTDGGWSIGTAPTLAAGPFELRLAAGAPAPDCRVDEPCLASACHPEQGCFAIALDGVQCSLPRGEPGSCVEGQCASVTGICQ